jgi:hypothetical protein
VNASFRLPAAITRISAADADDAANAIIIVARKARIELFQLHVIAGRSNGSAQSAAR